MLDLTQFIGGGNRWYIPPVLYLFIESIHIVVLTWIIVIPMDTMKGSLKQLISIPFLVSLMLFPLTFSMNNNFVSFSIASVNFTLFLRYFELYWVGPLIEHKPVYTTLHQLSTCLWSFVRRYDKKEPVEKKTLLSVIMGWIGFSLLSDILINWLTSFTGHEVMMLMQQRPILYFFYCFGSGTTLYACFKSLNYMIQLIYTLLFQQGHYTSELWRDVPKNPLAAKNLHDLWSHRWHQTFKSTWLCFPFRSVYVVCNTCLPKSMSYLCASLSVFFISGMMHEYIVAANVEWRAYRHVAGEQVIFFMAQGVGVVLEQLVKRWVPARCDLVPRLWGILFIYFTFYYMAHGFLLFDFHLHHSFRFTRPYLAQLAYSHPLIRSFFGSQI